jgi:molecular chaperone GrpE
MTWRIYQHPSELDGNDTVWDLDEDGSVESVPAPADPSAQLQADINTAKAEIAEWQDRFLRKAAEFENYRKRTEKEKMEAMMLAKSSVLMEFLPVLDACERALKSFSDAQTNSVGLQQYQEGVELLYKQVLDAIARTGVVPMETEGKPFDPHLHEALSREETSDLEENTVVRELRRGYLFREKLLRPAQVIVAVHPLGKNRKP